MNTIPGGLTVTEDVRVFILKNAGQTRLIAGSRESLPPLDLPQPTAPSLAVGRTALQPSPKRRRDERRRSVGFFRSIFGA